MTQPAVAAGSQTPAEAFMATSWKLRDASRVKGLADPRPKKWEAHFTDQDLPLKPGTTTRYLPAYVAITYEHTTVRLRARSRGGSERCVFVAGGVLPAAPEQQVSCEPTSFPRYWLERVTRDPVDRLLLAGFALVLGGLAIDLGNLLGSTGRAVAWRNVDADTLTNLAIVSLVLKAVGFATAYWKTVEEWRS